MDADTPKTKDKVNDILSKLTEDEKESVKNMSTFKRSQFLTERFGNDDEKFGISFALFPIWVLRVEEAIT